MQLRAVKERLRLVELPVPQPAERQVLVRVSVHRFRHRTEVHAYPLAEANSALDDLAHGRFEGAAGLTIG